VHCDQKRPIEIRASGLLQPEGIRREIRIALIVENIVPGLAQPARINEPHQIRDDEGERLGPPLRQTFEKSRFHRIGQVVERVDAQHLIRSHIRPFFAFYEVFKRPAVEPDIRHPRLVCRFPSLTNQGLADIDAHNLFA